MRSTDLLQELKDQMSEVINVAETDFPTLTDHQLNFREGEGRWSVLEVFEHLNRYSRYYNPAIRNAVASASPVNPHEVASTWMGRKSIASVHPSNAKRQKTMKHLNPVNSTLDRHVMEEFFAHQKTFLGLLDEVSDRDLNRIKIPVEFFRLIRLPLGEILQFVVFHEQRHLHQVRTILGNVKKNTKPMAQVRVSGR